MAKIEPANLLLTDKDGNTGLVKSLTNKDITTLKGVVTNVDYIKDYMNTNNITLPVQGDIHLTATDEEGNNGKTLLGTSSGKLTWGGKNLVRSVNGVNADTDGNVNISFMPDYSTAVTYPITTTEQTLVIPYDCLLNFETTGYNGNYGTLYIDNVLIIKRTSNAHTFDMTCHFSGYVKKGSIVKYKSGFSDNPSYNATNLLTLFKI